MFSTGPSHRFAAGTPVLACLLTTLLFFVATSEAQTTTDGEHPPTAETNSNEGMADLSQIGAGELMWKSDHGLVPLPVVETRVLLEVGGVMLSGHLTQRFENPTEEVIEVQYIFPLPERAAVYAMEMVIGQRRIVSKVQEKAEAQRTYEHARREGRKAALAAQDRPNLFRVSAANINPGETVLVKLSFVQEVDLLDGVFSHTFPMTFTPRYSSGGPGAVAGDCARVPPAQGSSHEAAPVFPMARFEMRIDAGFELAGVECASHQTETHWEGETWVITPRGGSLRADRDIRVSWRPLLVKEPQAAFLTERRGGDLHGGLYGLLMLLPPGDNFPASQMLATETIFVVDISGSMQGRSIVHARDALASALRRLHAGDRFNIVAFNNSSRIYSPSLQPVNARQVGKAVDWVLDLEANGGTEILPALRQAISLAQQGGSTAARRIIFLTDGAVSNEKAVFDQIAGQLGDIRLHTIGIGSAPNAWLMRQMAHFGRGHCVFIADSQGTENEIDVFLERIDRPVMKDLRLGWAGIEPSETWPARLPDLYPGEPLVVSAFFPEGQAPRSVTLHGMVAGGKVALQVPLRALRSGPTMNRGIALRWARAKVRSLLASLHEGADEMADEMAVRASVISLGKSFHLVTRYTSLVAVEEFASAFEPARSVQAANLLPSGSETTLTLPRGGTLGPLLMLIGLLLILAGGMLLALPALWQMREQARLAEPPPAVQVRIPR